MIQIRLEKRIVYQEQKATVLFEGPLVHEDRGDEIWVGVEWDDPSRGKHNGTVGEHTYFVTRDGGNSGSLLRRSKVSFGEQIVNAVFLKYFKEVPQDLLIDDTPHSKMVTVAQTRQVVVEFDRTAFFETIKKKKKMVEFYGFDEIYKKINNFAEIKELSLESQLVQNIGPSGLLGSVFQQLQWLSLEDNLLYSWHQVFQICIELKHLKELTISGNYLQLPGEEEHVYDCESQQFLQQEIVGSCDQLEVLVLINMRLTWKAISRILPAFRGLQSLLLCRNHLIDYENLEIKDNLPKLKLLNLEDTVQSNFGVIQQSFGHLPIDRLILSRNNISSMIPVTSFTSLTHISLDHNPLNQCKFLSQLSGLKLTSMSIKHIPIQERLGKLYSRQRAIAEIGTLEQLNGSQITKFERKDSEIFYLKSSFEEYFILRKVKHYYYDYEDFLKYASEHHPRIPYLIQKFGNPYEIDPTVKGDIQQKPQNNVQYCMLTIVDLVGKLKGKPTNKKFLNNTGIFPVKQVVSKLTGTNIKDIKVSLKTQEEIVLMDGKDCTLLDYGVQDGSEIIVELI